MTLLFLQASHCYHLRCPDWDGSAAFGHPLLCLKDKIKSNGDCLLALPQPHSGVLQVSVGKAQGSPLCHFYQSHWEPCKEMGKSPRDDQKLPEALMVKWAGYHLEREVFNSNMHSR